MRKSIQMDVKNDTVRVSYKAWADDQLMRKFGRHRAMLSPSAVVGVSQSVRTNFSTAASMNFLREIQRPSGYRKSELRG